MKICKEKMQAGVSGANDNTEWKWVWKHGGNAESVAKKGGLLQFQ